ncbi:uncharacterized protein LOC136084687 isoform X1 [Hydra vulgaris]|uniref:Uncharacterized protein LOC136084687 isoform X1 n=1 Tax=Hydra vulgaris TaxID=6087 RepID=A0ABM4CHU8_HYDVU
MYQVGMHCIFLCTKIKDKLKYPNKLTATANRKKVSTLFAIMDLPPQDRELFYQHMGHSKDINQNVYQVPSALLEITKVGRHLIDIEKGKHKVVNRTVLQAPTSDDLKENTNNSTEDGKNTDTLYRWKTNKRVNLDEENESGLDEKKKKNRFPTQ